MNHSKIKTESQHQKAIKRVEFLISTEWRRKLTPKELVELDDLTYAIENFENEL